MMNFFICRKRVDHLSPHMGSSQKMGSFATKVNFVTKGGAIVTNIGLVAKEWSQ